MRVRLKFFTQRFRRSQARWQFVLWVRQIALVLVATFTPNGIVGAVLTLVILAVSLYTHMLCRPFRFKLTNRVEAGLLFICCCLLGLACLYDRVSLFTEGWVRVVLQVCLVFPIYFVVLVTIAGALWLSSSFAEDAWVEEEDVDWDEEDEEDEEADGGKAYTPHDEL